MIEYNKKLVIKSGYLRKLRFKHLLILSLLALACFLTKTITTYDNDKHIIKDFQSSPNIEKCRSCHRYSGMGVNVHRACKQCYNKVIDSEVSTAARKRNEYLLQYHKKSKLSKTSEQRLPDIIGIGVRKCGTGWLQHVLLRHPFLKINMKETHYFNLYKNYKLGINYYRSLMPNVTEYEKVMEKTPGYFNFPRWDVNLPEVIHRDVPNAKLWLILCEPAHRALSDYVEVKSSSEEDILPDTFEKYVEQYLPQAQKVYNTSLDLKEIATKWCRMDFISIILSLGIYYPMMEEWTKHYTEENLHIISGEEMITDPGKVVEKVQEFLRLPKLILAEDFVQNTNTGFYCISPTVVIDSELYKIPMQCMSETVKGKTRALKFKKTSSIKKALQKLESFFRPFDEKLFKILGRRLW